MEASAACKTLGGPWAQGIDAAAAALTVHEPLEPGSGMILLEGDGKPLVVEKAIGGGRVLVIASGAFLVNEAVVKGARRPLAERVVDWTGAGAGNVAMVEGAHVLGEIEMPTIWSLLKRLPVFRWVAIQVGLAALMAALARAPRLGRPRPAPPSAADRPVEHALALGALLARVGAAERAREILDLYRRWRHSRVSHPALSAAGARGGADEAAASAQSP